jgi:MmyB-like transcription regulator ligand binding domain
VVDTKFDILAWNDMAAALVMDWSAVPPKERNAIRWLFVPPRELDAQHGRMALETLVIPERDQRLMMFTAAPGTPSHEALRLLRVVGVQDLTSSERR